MNLMENKQNCTRVHGNFRIHKIYPTCATSALKDLTCHINFYQRCLEGMRKVNPMKKPIIFPICRKATTSSEAGSSDLPNSFSLINLTHQAIIAMSTITCGNCDEKDEAVIYCQECAEYLCEICNNAHLRSKKTKDHKTAQSSQQNVKFTPTETTARLHALRIISPT